MGFRAVALDCLTLFLTGLMGFVYLGVFGLGVLPFSFGALSGLVCGVAMGMRFVRGLAETGEVRVSCRTLSFILLTFGGVLLILIGALLALDVDAKIQFLNFLWPLAFFLYAGRIAVFLRWELKHRLHIMFGYSAYGLLRRIYTMS